jgi:transcription antitermination factor NusA-like protein
MKNRTLGLSQIKKEELEALLKLEAPESEEGLPEDLRIIQPDGSRACISYELAGRGFSLVPEKEMNRYSK